MTYTIKKSCVRSIKKGDPMFYIVDNNTLVPRAGFELKTGMPNTYRDVVTECINRGWLVPVAYLKDSELMWEILQK